MRFAAEEDDVFLEGGCRGGKEGACLVLVRDGDSPDDSIRPNDRIPGSVSIFFRVAYFVGNSGEDVRVSDAAGVDKSSRLLADVEKEWVWGRIGAVWNSISASSPWSGEC